MAKEFIIIFDTNDGQKETTCTAEQLKDVKATIKNLYGEFAINTISSIE